MRSLDSACNPYLAYSVLLAAGMKGIEEGYELPEGAEDDRPASCGGLRRADGARLVERDGQLPAGENHDGTDSWRRMRRIVRPRRRLRQPRRAAPEAETFAASPDLQFTFTRSAARLAATKLVA